MARCKHKNKTRLYERSKKWTSTPFYSCQDCGEVIQVAFTKVKPKTMQKPIREKTKDAFCEEKQ